VPIARGATLEKRAELSTPEKKKDHFRNVKTAAKGSRIAQVSGHLRASDLLSERFVLI